MERLVRRAAKRKTLFINHGGRRNAEERSLTGGFPPFSDQLASHYSVPNLCGSIDQQRSYQCGMTVPN